MQGVINIKAANFIITDFNNIFTANDHKGKTIEIKNRYCSSFIVTLSGSIRFTYANGNIVADSNHPVFIPEGLTYKNECIEDAKSLVFNFHTLERYAKPCSLSAPSYRFAEEKYKEIEKALVSGNTENKMSVLSTLYALAAKLFSTRQKLSAGNETINKATEYICLNYALSNLTVSQVARECFVSEIYLRKLFGQKLNTTPFYYITKVRMTHARNLIQEKMPIKEVAGLVGYSDIYQFSRAYKKHFGYPPSATV